jgi:hypothetical protein
LPRNACNYSQISRVLPVAAGAVKSAGGSGNLPALPIEQGLYRS